MEEVRLLRDDADRLASASKVRSRTSTPSIETVPSVAS
jgi:hypothetical protein